MSWLLVAMPLLLVVRNLYSMPSLRPVEPRVAVGSPRGQPRCARQGVFGPKNEEMNDWMSSVLLISIESKPGRTARLELLHRRAGDSTRNASIV